jgi:hypothetical protein
MKTYIRKVVMFVFLLILPFFLFNKFKTKKGQANLFFLLLKCRIRLCKDWFFLTFFFFLLISYILLIFLISDKSLSEA